MSVSNTSCLGFAEGMQERKLLDWHMANLEFANAQLLQRLSMRSWDQDDPHELPGAHCFLPGAAYTGAGFSSLWCALDCVTAVRMCVQYAFA